MKKNSVLKTFIPLLIFVFSCAGVMGLYIASMIAFSSAAGVSVLRSIIFLLLLIITLAIGSRWFFKYYLSLLKKEYSANPTYQKIVFRRGGFIVYGIFATLFFAWQISNRLESIGHSTVFLFLLFLISGIASILYYFVIRSSIKEQ